MTTHYVDATNGNDVNDGISESEPWQSLDNINPENVSAGDTVSCKRGEVWEGTLTVPVGGLTFSTYGRGPNPVIDAGGKRPYCFHGEAKSGIIIEDYTVIGFRASGIADYRGNDWTIKHCEGKDGGTNSAPDNVIRVWHANGDSLLTGIVVQANTVGEFNTTDLYHAGAVAIQLQGVDGAVVSDNTIAPVHCMGIRLARAGSSSPNNRNVVLERNRVTKTYGPQIVVHGSDGTHLRFNDCHGGRGGGVGIGYGSNYTEAYYNLIHSNSEVAGLSAYNGFDVNHNSQNGLLHHNIVYAVPRHCLMIDDETAACNGWEMRHNIFDASQNVDSGRISGNIRTVCVGIRGATTDWMSGENVLVGKSFVDERGIEDTWIASIGDGDGILHNFADWRSLYPGDIDTLRLGWHIQRNLLRSLN